MQKDSDTSVRLLSYRDDQPKNGQGLLIPRKRESTKVQQKFDFAVLFTVLHSAGFRVTMGAFAALLLAVVGITGYGLVSQMNLASVPSVTIVDTYNDVVATLEYGPHHAFQNGSLFVETRDSFIDEGVTFVEVNLADQQLRFFKKGVLIQSVEIFGVGAAGSWWETPPGLYKIEQKEKREFTTVGQVYLPWLLTFQGNFIIHGTPVYPDQTPVAEGFVGGGIRLSDAEAKALYENVRVGTPVLVYANSPDTSDDFVYQPQVPGLDTPHYFIADINNGTILAASDLNEVAPIASLTKLMTAVVAAENIDLDSRVRITSPNFVTSLVPRLSGRGSVSMYSLLQLLLVESSNEAADTIAGEVGRDKFIELMNAKARQLGMLSTTFADPSGLSAENVSSVGDLYRLVKYIHEQRSFIFEITANASLPSVYVSGEFDGLINFNEVEDMDSFVGGKVGETIAAGQTSISLHKLSFQGEERILAVIILGSSKRTKDIETLITYVKSRFGG